MNLDKPSKYSADERLRRREQMLSQISEGKIDPKEASRLGGRPSRRDVEMAEANGTSPREEARRRRERERDQAEQATLERALASRVTPTGLRVIRTDTSRQGQAQRTDEEQAAARAFGVWHENERYAQAGLTNALPATRHMPKG
jgi:hypothetical protein